MSGKHRCGSVGNSLRRRGALPSTVHPERLGRATAGWSARPSSWEGTVVMPKPRLLESPLPIVAAPMAGGVPTVALATAVAGAGGFAFMPAGYKSAEALAQDLDALRGIGAPFGVNLFFPGRSDIGG